MMFSTLLCVGRSTHGEPSGEPDDAVPGLDFDRRPDAALLACRELDDASSLPASTARRLAEARTGKRLGNPIKAVGCRHSRAKTMTQSHRLSL